MQTKTPTNDTQQQGEPSFVSTSTPTKPNPQFTIHNSQFIIAFAIFVAALAIRLYGIGFGLPYPDQPDEPSVADKSLRMLQTGDLDPHYFVYPHLYYYMQAALYGLRWLLSALRGHPIDLANTLPTDFYLWGRILTALLGAATSLCVYFAARRLYRPAVALPAALFIAFNAIAITNSQFITTDAPAGFFTALALLAITRILPNDKSRLASTLGGPPPPPTDDVPSTQHSALSTQHSALYSALSTQHYVIAGVAIGLAIGTKYNSAVIALTFVIAHAYAVGWRPARIFGPRLWLTSVVALLTFILTTPFILFDFTTFQADLQSVFTHYRSGHPGFESNQPLFAYLNYMWRGDMGVTLLAALGLLVALVRRRPADVVLLSFPLVYLALMSQYVVVFPRNLLPMLPFVVILAALPFDLLWNVLQNSKLKTQNSKLIPAALVLIAILAIASPALAAYQNGAKNSHPDTRALAAAWLDEHAPAAAKLWLEPFSLLLPNKYIVQGGDGVTGHDMTWYTANHFDYLILSEGYYGKFFSDLAQQAEANGYTHWRQQNQPYLVADFPRNPDHPGPSISIYRTDYVRPTAASINPQHRLSVKFSEADGGSLTLLGYDTGDGKAGGTLPLTLYWQCDAPLKADYTVFVHLLDAKGGNAAQRDNPPRSGSYPTSQWQAGEIIVDEQDVPLPTTLAPGQYPLEVGLYLPTTFARLTTPDGTNSTHLGNASVKL